MTQAPSSPLHRNIAPRPRWDHLNLPPEPLAVLHQIAGQARQGEGIHENQSLVVLFAGAPGSGRTTAAKAIAGDLGRDLIRVDLSAVANQYLGETEKHLGQVLAAAEAQGAVLFFDEADALFGRRTEVKDSHDRYANLEVAHLLQSLEGYRGLAILSTNHKQALDPAFLRRLRFIVDFPRPAVPVIPRLVP